MTERERLQALYDEHGSIDRAAAASGINRNTLFLKFRREGVQLKRRGGWSKRHTETRMRRLDLGRPGRAVSIHCAEECRPCVIHDLPGACDVCRKQRNVEHYVNHGASSSWTTEVCSPRCSGA